MAAAAAGSAAARMLPLAAASLSTSASSMAAQSADERMDSQEARISRLEALEKARSAMGQLLTFLDDSRVDPKIITAARLADMFTPSAVVDLGEGKAGE